MSAAHLKVDNEHIQKSYIEGRCQSHFFSISNHATSIISILPQFLTNPPGSRLFDVGNKIAKNASHSMEWRPFSWNGKATGLDDTFCSITYLKNALNSLNVGPHPFAFQTPATMSSDPATFTRFQSFNCLLHFCAVERWNCFKYPQCL